MPSSGSMHVGQTELPASVGTEPGSWVPEPSFQLCTEVLGRSGQAERGSPAGGNSPSGVIQMLAQLCGGSGLPAPQLLPEQYKQ